MGSKGLMVKSTLLVNHNETAQQQLSHTGLMLLVLTDMTNPLSELVFCTLLFVILFTIGMNEVVMLTL